MARKKSKEGSRLQREDGFKQTSRAEEDRSTETREISDSVRLDMFRESLFQSALPDIPPIDGWHVCWLTTTNPRDSIQSRMALGYEPVRPEDVPGMEFPTLKSGDYEGCIGVNEMVAFKLPLHLYEMYMKEVHYDQPLSEEEKLIPDVELIRSAASAAGVKNPGAVKIIAEEGQAGLGQAPGIPNFSAHERGE